MIEPSIYQTSIMNSVKYDKGNLLIDAKAGSGKTSTLIMISDELTKQNKNSLFLAFNKTIIEELQVKLGNNNKVMIKTLNALGYSFLLSDLYKRYGMNGYEVKILGSNTRTRRLVKEYVDENLLEDIKFARLDIASDKRMMKDLYDSIIDAFINCVNFTRYYYIDFNDENTIKDLLDNEANKFTETLSEHNGITNIPALIKTVIQTTIDDYRNPQLNDNGKPYFELDFIDQLYLPVYFNLRVPYKYYPYLDYIEIDESQDLSILQQRLLQKLNNGKTRYIFVGDKKQSIYGFAGADTHSIDNIRINFILKELPLNICYRCPKKVIQIAKEIVPSIEWNIKREDEGVINVIPREGIGDKLKAGDLVISRFNSKLVGLFIELVLHKKRRVKFRNSAIVKSILRDLTDVIATYISRYNRYENIELELEDFINKSEIQINKKLRNKTEVNLVNQKAKQLITKNKSVPKAVIKKDYNVGYLISCMSEYKQYGSYKFVGDDNHPQYDEDTNLKEYFNIILEFLSMYLEIRFNKTLEDCLDNSRNILTIVKVEEFLVYLEDFLLAQSQGITDCPILSSVHQMKGGEADNVYILEYSMLPFYKKDMTEEDMIQETNLKYVAITRAKKELNLVLANPDDYWTPELPQSKNLELLQNIKNKYGETFANIDEDCYNYCG